MAFHPDFSLIKKHPVATAGVVVAGGLLIYVLAHSSSGGGGTVVAGGSTPLDPAVVQAQTQIALANISAGMANSQGQMQLAGQAADIGAQLTIHSMDLQSQGASLAANLQALGLQIGESHYEAGLNQQVQLAGINATTQSLADQLAAAVAQTQSNNSVTTHLADVQAATSIANTQMMTQLQGLIAQSQASVAVTQSNNQVNMAAINAHTAEYIAHQQQQSSGLGSILGFAGAVLGALL